jgi:2-desacetyl-2-hydroxyethyl bacteriochlorophyllide A dehydrogenase
MIKLRYITFPGQGKAEVREGECPDMAEDQIEVRTTCSLISPGTELAFFNGTHSDLKTGKRKYPTGSGYSNTGVVERVGSKVENFKPGDRVMCMAGHCSRFVISPERAYPIPDGVADEQASFAILGSIALHAIREAALAFGENALVLGLGVIGQLALRLARLTAANRIFAADMFPTRLEAARAGGADTLLNVAEEDAVALVREATGGRGCEVVIEASGNHKAIATALKCAARRARVMILGCPHGDATLDLYTELQKNELQLIGSYQPNCPEIETAYTPWTQRRNRELILEYLRQGRLDFAPLLTHKAEPEQAQEVYEALAREQDRAIGGLFYWM